MAKSDERWRLAEIVDRLERVLRAAQTSGGSLDTSILVSNIESLKDRMEIVEREVAISQEEKNQLTVREAAMVYLMERETALTHNEREQYGAFLSREFFTKDDFGSLAGFYENTWDRLSEDGKAQMSHRVWEGVRQEQYQFSELPEAVKEKEGQRLYQALKNEVALAGQLERIPQADRHDFVTAWQSGKHEEAYQVLNRSTFTDNVAVSPNTMNSTSAVGHDLTEGVAVRKTEKTETQTEEKSRATGTVDVLSIDIQLADANTQSVAPPRLSEPTLVAKAIPTPGN